MSLLRPLEKNKLLPLDVLLTSEASQEGAFLVNQILELLKLLYRSLCDHLVLKNDSQRSLDVLCERCDVFPRDFRINFRKVRYLSAVPNTKCWDS